MGDSRECRALGKYHDKLVAVIKNNLNDIALFLRNKGIIKKEQYDTFTNTLLREDHVRARMMWTAIDNKIVEDENIFVTFVKHLYSKEQYHIHGVALIREYEKLGKTEL